MTKTVEEVRRDPPIEIIRECFLLDSDTGDLYWKKRPAHHFKTEKAMKIITTRDSGNKINDYDKGYLRATIFGKKYVAHRIVWALHYGSWPKGQIDHIDGNTTNNKIENLRDVSNSENQKNSARKRNTSTKLMGVCWHKGISKWVSYIGENGKLKQLGSYHSFFDAVCARKSAEKRLNFHENHGREYFIHPNPAAIEQTGLGLKVKP